MDLIVGTKFDSYEVLQKVIIDYESKNFCNLKVRESRTLKNVQHKIKKVFNESLIYYEIKYVCFFGPLYNLKLI